MTAVASSIIQSLQDFARQDLSPRAMALIVAVFASVVSLAGLFSLPPLDRDEARFIQASAQMIETGDFVSIRFQDTERNKKPVGIHWLQTASVTAFSSVEARQVWAYRLPSVLGAIIAAVSTAFIGALLFGPRTGLLAGLSLAAAPALAGEATIAKTDAVLLATICLAQLCLARMLHRRRSVETEDGRRKKSPEIAVTIGFWLALGAGILIKGPIAPLIVGLTIGAVLWRDRQDRRHRDPSPEKSLSWRNMLKPFIGMAILVLMTAPWAIAIGEATQGRFFIDALGGDMFAKVGGAQERHWGPPGYHTLLTPLLFWPIAALLPTALYTVYRERHDWRVFFLLAWIVPSWIIFEASSTKLPHYVLPLYPALAILTAHSINLLQKKAQVSARVWARLQKSGACFYAAIGLFLAAAPYLAMRNFGDEAQSPLSALPGGFLIALLTLIAARFFWRSAPRAGLFTAAIASAAFVWQFLQFTAPTLNDFDVSRRLAALIDEAGLHAMRDDAAPTILLGYNEPSAVFLLGTDTVIANPTSAVTTVRQTDRPRAIVVEDRQAEALEAAFIKATNKDWQAGAASALAPIGDIDGVNYSKGDRVTLRVYKVSPFERASSQ